MPALTPVPVPVRSAIAHGLDMLASWRDELGQQISGLGRLLADNELLDDADVGTVSALRERLASDKLVVAFVAEFSRGKSELINAIFFADAGRRVLPATPGRTTMCPVELRYDEDMPARLSLLPIETRLRGLSLAELRGRDEPWQHVPLDTRDARMLASALGAVTRTQRVSVEQARALGFWSDEQPDDNPPQAADGSVEVPAWRHALINYPHPLLQRGLVVIDTPGLNAIGAEPELTLGLLPNAHAVVFVLAADTGVTKSDLAIWREHLGAASLERFVVLNKIDTLADPLATPPEVAAQIERQRSDAAATLEVPPARVFALSARDALAARVERGADADALAASGLPPLERALAAELLQRRRELLVQSVLAVVQQLRASGTRRLADRRRQVAEQLLELRGLRGKSGTKLRMMIERVDAEAAEFERCTARLAALRAVQMRILRSVMAVLGSDALRVEVAAMQSAIGARPFNLGGRSAFAALMTRLRAALARAEAQSGEMRQMLDASFAQLNAEFGFAFVVSPLPSLAAYAKELGRIEDNYGRYFGFGQAWRMATPGFAEQFRRMLLAKLRVVFENAAGEIELWSKAASGQVELQLRERRRAFARRREALQRVQGASDDLEQRIAEVQQQDEQLATMHVRIEQLAAQAEAGTRRLYDDTPATLALDLPPRQQVA
ncbi:MAG: dynamin family protein [Burkholderiales bacterium]|nr:dynamin family protein [Burkholderiales bacterium]